jgi:four helix bundle protein
MEKKRKDDELSDRLLNFAILIIRLCSKLPDNWVGNHVSRQILKCGTSPGANYEEARGAESTADFIHKLGIVLKELKESRYWLKVIQLVPLYEPDSIAPVLDECEQLIAIIAKSIFTARKSQQKHSKKR